MVSFFTLITFILFLIVFNNSKFVDDENDIEKRNCDISLNLDLSIRSSIISKRSKKLKKFDSFLKLNKNSIDFS